MIFWALALVAGMPRQAADNSALIRRLPGRAPLVMERVLEKEKPTLFVFYQETSAADRDVARHLEEKILQGGRVGLRLIPLPTLSAPAAQTYDIRQTPTLMLLDRFGKLKLRTSSLEELGPAVVKASRMQRIKWVDEDDPEAEKTYDFRNGRRREVAGILKTMSLRPELMQGINRIAGMAHFSNGFLPRRTKEMIATYVSAVNHCKF